MNNQTRPKPEHTWTHRADNRERLIAAGYAILAEKGYESTTVKEVARVAGVSPGLFHYYFASKDDLLIAVLQEAGQRSGRMMRELQPTVPSDRFPEAILAALRERVTQDPGWYRIRFEFFALALRDPKFLPVLGELLARPRQGFAQAYQQSSDGDDARTHAVAAVMLACVDGLALQQLAQPETDLSAAYDLVRSLIAPKAPAP